MTSRTLTTLLFALTMALAGFLLFQVQPVLAKFILPWFGGSATTWIVCMLFFQLALLAGYGWAYGLTLPLSVPAQAKAQIVVLALTLLLLPITPSDVWKPTDAGDPTWRIVLLLAASVGVPYLVLATTSPLLSRWLANSDLGLDPARFFAASNLGSFAGLLSYPFVFERALSSLEQTRLWSIAFVVYAALFAACAFVSMRHARAKVEPPADADAPAHDRVGLWIFWSLLGSMLLLATTNAITQWSAVIPFLWIAPLSLYLLTFVIAFGHRGLYHRGWYALIFVVLAALAVWSPAPDESEELLAQIALHCAAVFFGCMICHAEMAALQPAPRRLPKFYLTIAFGGALGGVLVALVAPLVMSDYFEHPLTLAAIGLSVLWLMARERGESKATPLRPALIGATALGLAVGVSGMAYAEISLREKLIERVRNFYGVVKIIKEDEDDPDDFNIVMQQAGVEQGSQYQKAERKMRPFCSFDERSGVGVALFNHAKRRAGGPQAPIRIGIVGLGAGMLAAHGQPGDVIRYYEINPAVAALTDRYFTFLKDGKAKTDVLLGDGRLVLERQLRAGEPQRFDVLVIDAFRGASPPMHLMTREAFDIYLAHLAADGILAINFELDTFEMAPLHRGMAQLFDMDVKWFETPSRSGCDEPVSWALYSRDKALFADEKVARAASPWRDEGAAGIVWTDASSNLMSIINFGR